MNTRGNRLWSWLGHPATLIALLVLVVNDHLLKDLWPGPVTGKLSDAAGLVLAPPLLALLVRRPAVALWSVGVGFFLVKAFPYGAELASAAWSLAHGPSIVRADPTDLLTLPFLGVAWWAYRTAVPAAPRWLRAFRVAVVLPLALVGVAATSAVQWPEATRVTSDSDGIHLYNEETWPAEVISRDNGLTWTEAVRPSASPVLAPVAPPAPQTQDCSGAEPLVCYRVVPKALGVDRSVDGGRTWSTDWLVTEDDRATLARHYPDLGRLDDELASVAIAVHDRRSGGHVVLVADGRDGFAMREPGGRWQRIGFPASSADPPPALGEKTGSQRVFELGTMIAVIVLLGGLVILTGGAVAAGRGSNRRSAWWLAPGLVAGGVVIMIAFAYAGLEEWPLSIFLVVSPAVTGVVTIGLAITVTAQVNGRGPDRGRWTLITWAAGLLTALLALGVWLAPGSVGSHLLVSALCCLPGMVLAVLAARRIKPAPPTTSSPMPYGEWSSSHFKV